MAHDVDVAVVGGGAAGLSAALQARRRDASVLLVEANRLGGDCTWTGCVPSKALIERAAQLQGARRRGGAPGTDFAQIMGEVRSAVTTIARDESPAVLRWHGVEFLEGVATFSGPRRLDVEGTPVTAGAVILATGSAPTLPPVDGLRGARPLTNETVFELAELPPRLAIMGGGPIGMELAQAFARLGSAVTVLQRRGRLLTKEEPEAAEVLERVLRAEGVDVRLGAGVRRVRRDGDDVRLETADGETVEADELLCAVGRSPGAVGMDLARAGVDRDERGFVRVDDRLRTTAPGVYAVGDAVGGPFFTHAAYDMGALAANNALGRRQARWSTRGLPWVTFTDPEIGRVGMTEAQAHARYGASASVAFLPLGETDRGRATGHTDGFVKLVAGPRPVLRGLGGGQLLGATVMCPAGGDVVHEAALAVRTRMLTGRLAQTVHAYPSWSLALRQTAAQFFRKEGGRFARPARAA